MATSSLFKKFVVQDDEAADRLIALDKETVEKKSHVNTNYSELERKKELLKQKIRCASHSKMH